MPNPKPAPRPSPKDAFRPDPNLQETVKKGTEPSPPKPNPTRPPFQGVEKREQGSGSGS